MKSNGCSFQPGCIKYDLVSLIIEIGLTVQIPKDAHRNKQNFGRTKMEWIDILKGRYEQIWNKEQQHNLKQLSQIAAPVSIWAIKILTIWMSRIQICCSIITMPPIPHPSEAEAHWFQSSLWENEGRVTEVFLWWEQTAISMEEPGWSHPFMVNLEVDLKELQDCY